MNLLVISRILGVLLMLFSVTQLPPMLVSLYYADTAFAGFSLALVVTLVAGLCIWFPSRNCRRDLRTRDGFLVVTLFWSVLGTFGALPFLLTDSLGLGFTDAVFESVSGLTTTGATVISGLDVLPRSILYYRQQLQWLGGLGIIAIAVAILPMLGIGGLQLYRAESPGPVKNDKLMPRVAETAKALLLIYLGLTIACGLAYHLAGMSPFDAIGHSFATVAIGGFSTHDGSIGYFDSPAIEFIAIFFMIVSGVNFALHFFAFRNQSIRHYFSDTEFRVYIGLLLSISAITVVFLIISGTFAPGEAFVKGIFEVVSISTTTGFSSTDFTAWPTFLPYLLFYMAIIGSCAGSSGGGIKVIRIVLIVKQVFVRSSG